MVAETKENDYDSLTKCVLFDHGIGNSLGMPCAQAGQSRLASCFCQAIENAA
jgi:hypothetical protein